MRFEELLHTVQRLPLFSGSLLLAGDRDPSDVRRQLVRWKESGKILQLRRNLYVLAHPWRRVEPHPFLVANHLRSNSYVSVQSALGYHGLIPEAVPVTVSVTTGRPVRLDTPLGRFLYRHVDHKAFFGYQLDPVLPEQTAKVADPAKALLDLCYLTPRGDAPGYLHSLRLAGLESVSVDDLRGHARRWDKPKVRRAADNLMQMAEESEASTS